MHEKSEAHAPIPIRLLFECAVFVYFMCLFTLCAASCFFFITADGKLDKPETVEVKYQSQEQLVTVKTFSLYVTLVTDLSASITFALPSPPPPLPARAHARTHTHAHALTLSRSHALTLSRSHALTNTHICCWHLAPVTPLSANPFRCIGPATWRG